MPDASAPPRLGERIIVVGTTNSGKSTLGLRLATHLGVPHIELDALFWRPDWTEPPTEEFRATVAEAVEPERWVMSGSYYSKQSDISWPLADQLLWLDVGPRTTAPRALRRAWRRWRRDELLWGTNRERFWSQLKLWDTQQSLIGFALFRTGERRRTLQARTTDPRWSHIDFVRLRGQRAIDAWVAEAMRATAGADGTSEQWRSA